MLNESHFKYYLVTKKEFEIKIPNAFNKNM